MKGDNPVRYLLFVIVVFVMLIANNCVVDGEVEESEDLTVTIQYKSIEGIAVNLLSLDIYYANLTSDKKPVVIYVHGGGWSIGDKTNQLNNKINLFRSLAYVFVSINYRLSPFPYEITNSDRIKFPDHNNDIADAIKWVFENINDYGGNKDKIAILGHSAGAQLVALTGTKSSFFEQRGLSLSVLKGVAVIDTAGFDINEQIANGTNQDMYINAFGTNRDKNIEASPLFNIFNGVKYPKFFIAKRGSTQRITYADEFIGKLMSFGVQVTQIDGSIYSHSEINDAIGAANETLITEPIKQFLKDCLE